MRRRKEKTKEEKTAESFFPVDKEDIKYAVEKEIKEIRQEDIEKIEFPGSKKPRKPSKTPKKSPKYSKKNGTVKDFSPAKISLKKDSYELIITEKPQAASKIAAALGRHEKKVSSGVPYY